MASYIERRKFLATLGGAAAWPLAARGQQPAMPVIGFLRDAPLADATHLVASFREGLRKQATPRARTSQSNTALQKIKPIGYRL
jgi:hypothetical protein